MAPTGPKVELDESGERWKIILKDFSAFESRLGKDVLNGFCRCFIHADRLTSTVSCIYASEQLHGRNSVAFERDLHSMVWFTIGTLRELATAIRNVRSALARRKLLDSSSSTWTELKEIEKRWEDDQFFRMMRNKAAFHVDDDVVDKGLTKLLEQPDVCLTQGDGKKSVQSLSVMSLEAMHNGLEFDLESYGRFLQHVSEDHGVGEAIQRAFIEAAEAAGITFGSGQD